MIVLKIICTVKKGIRKKTQRNTLREIETQFRQVFLPKDEGDDVIIVIVWSINSSTAFCALIKYRPTIEGNILFDPDILRTHSCTCSLQIYYVLVQ